MKPLYLIKNKDKLARIGYQYLRTANYEAKEKYKENLEMKK